MNPIAAAKAYFKSRKDKKELKRKERAKLWQMQTEKNEKDFYKHGFHKIKFPILLVDGEINDDKFEFYDYDFNIVWDLNEFSCTNWYHSPCLVNEAKLIDCNREIWSFKYNSKLGASTPGSLIGKMELHELNQFIIKSISGWRNETRIAEVVERADSMTELFEELGLIIN